MSALAPTLTPFLAAWLPPAPARVLDAGCGAGAITRHLAAQGYDVVGLDPIAPEGEPFVRGRLEDLENGVGPVFPFDAAVAIRSLHHVDDLDEALDALSTALRPRARIAVFEFAVEGMDDAALRWLRAHGVQRDSAPHGIFTLAEVRAALDRRFRELHFEPAPYLALEFDRPDLLDDERAALAGGELRPAAAYAVYER